MIKRITLLGFVLLAFFIARAQDPIFEESFENVQTPNGIAPLPSHWTVHKKDTLNPVNDENFNHLLTEAWNVDNLVGLGKMAESTCLLDNDGQTISQTVTPEKRI